MHTGGGVLTNREEHCPKSPALQSEGRGPCGQVLRAATCLAFACLLVGQLHKILLLFNHKNNNSSENKNPKQANYWNTKERFLKVFYFKHMFLKQSGRRANHAGSSQFSLFCVWDLLWILPVNALKVFSYQKQLSTGPRVLKPN